MDRRPRSEIGRDVVTSRSQVVGFAARANLQPGRPLRAGELMKPDLVQRSEPVTLVYEVPGVVLTLRGKAIDGGAEGDTISVINEQSKRTCKERSSVQGGLLFAKVHRDSPRTTRREPRPTPMRGKTNMKSLTTISLEYQLCPTDTRFSVRHQ